MDEYTDLLKKWRKDPVSFVRDNFGVEPDPWQAEFLVAFNDNQRIAAKACKGPGKTAVLAWCGWLFMATRPHAKCAATSITGDNLKDCLWAEFAKWQKKSPFLMATFVWRATRITHRIEYETWFMSARVWPKGSDATSQADTLAGLHADYMLFILDEAGGIPEAVMVAADAALATGIECKILMCGNPTHLSGPLYRACTRDKSLWVVIEITGDPDDPMRSPRISKKWAREQIKKYGMDSPWVLVNVYGKFPPSSLNALLGPEDARAAMDLVLRPEAYQHMPRVMGIDVARHGDDKSVIAARQGLAHFKPRELRIANTQQLAGAVARSIKKFQPDAVFIDATGGWGWGLIDQLQDWGYTVTPVHFNGKADHPQYFNKRTEMAFNLAHAVKNGACLPDLDELVEECTAQIYEFRGDKMKLIEKDQIKQDIGRSPDLFDAYMLCHAFPVARTSKVQEIIASRDVADGYNPMVADKYRPDAQNESDYDPLN